MASSGQNPWGFQLPPYDFVVLCKNTGGHFIEDKNNVQEYTMFEFDEEDLIFSISVTRLMGAIPPVAVTFYKDGIQTGRHFSAYFPKNHLTKKEIPKTLLVKKTEIFSSLDNYENRREELQKQENTYAFEEKSNTFFNANKGYILTWYEWEGMKTDDL